VSFPAVSLLAAVSAGFWKGQEEWTPVQRDPDDFGRQDVTGADPASGQK